MQPIVDIETHNHRELEKRIEGKYNLEYSINGGNLVNNIDNLQ